MIRVVFISILIALISISAATAQDTRLLSGGAVANVTAADGYELTVFARRLGDISAMDRHEDGTLYVAERGAGRIFRIQDRRLDGAADTTQPLAHRFDHPSGLALMGDVLFVSDRSGLWRINAGGGTPDLIAPFARSGSTGDPHPIAPIGADRLLLGLNRPDGTMRLLEIEIATGAARLREEGPGQIIGFSKARLEDGKFPEPWVLLTRRGETWFGQTLATSRNLNMEVNTIWLDEAQGQAVLALPHGVSTTVATFAGIRDKGQSLLSGFGSGTNGIRPGAILADMRGLFVSDQAGGRIWLISKTLEPEPVDIKTEEIVSEQLEQNVPRARPDLLRGSGITRSSTRGPASTMGPASTLKPADQVSEDTPPKE